jgi:hypothetical protein
LPVGIWRVVRDALVSRLFQSLPVAYIRVSLPFVSTGGIGPVEKLWELIFGKLIPTKTHHYIVTQFGCIPSHFLFASVLLPVDSFD